VELLPTAPLGDHETGVFEHLEVLHDADPGHCIPLDERPQRLSVVGEQSIEKAAPGGISECPEDFVHAVQDM
jgi:hypothetical protein